jgi:hypothetical protein
MGLLLGTFFSLVRCSVSEKSYRRIDERTQAWREVASKMLVFAELLEDAEESRVEAAYYAAGRALAGHGTGISLPSGSTVNIKARASSAHW